MNREINYGNDYVRNPYDWNEEPWKVDKEVAFPRFEYDLQFKKNSWGAAHDEFYQPLNLDPERSEQSRKYVAMPEYKYSKPYWNHTVYPPNYRQMFEQAAIILPIAPTGVFPRYDRNIYRYPPQKQSKK